MVDDLRLIRAGITLRRRSGGHDDGWHRDAIRTVDGDIPAGGVLHLKLRVGAGEVDVHRFQPGGVETLIGASG